MSHKLQKNVIKVRHPETGEMVPISTFSSGADESLTAIAKIANDKKQEIANLSELLTQKGNDVLATLPPDYIDLSADFTALRNYVDGEIALLNNIKNKLDIIIESGQADTLDYISQTVDDIDHRVDTLETQGIAVGDTLPIGSQIMWSDDTSPIPTGYVEIENPLKAIDDRVTSLETNGLMVSDTLPVGSVVDFEGDVIPQGWEEVESIKVGEIQRARGELKSSSQSSKKLCSLTLEGGYVYSVVGTVVSSVSNNGVINNVVSFIETGGSKTTRGTNISGGGVDNSEFAEVQKGTTLTVELWTFTYNSDTYYGNLVATKIAKLQ